jgi:hypothetical protein
MVDSSLGSTFGPIGSNHQQSDATPRVLLFLLHRNMFMAVHANSMHINIEKCEKTGHSACSLVHWSQLI